jgi:Fic family protein
MLPETLERFIFQTIVQDVVESGYFSQETSVLGKDVEKIFQILKKSKKFDTPQEGEIAGYISVLEMVFKTHDAMALGEQLIRQLHERMLRHSPIEMYRKGQYGFHGQSQANVVGLFMGQSAVPQAQKEIIRLIEWYTHQCDQRTKHPLILIAIFIFDYLKIAPFRDGNITSSRVITYFLLLKAGYHFVLISPLESLSPPADLKEWVFTFLNSMAKQASLSLKTQTEDVIEHLLSEKQNILWKWANENKSRTFSRKDAAEELGFPKRTVEEIIKKLTLIKRFQRIGEGKSTRYRVV